MSAFDFLSFTPKSKIGDITIAAALEEQHTDTLEATQHPVEYGAPITDHSYNRPAEVVIRAGWSNSSSAALIGALTALFGSGEMSQSDYCASVYSQLLKLKESRQPFSITTSRRQYTNMLMTSLAVTTDAKTSNILTVTATCRQIIIVSTQALALPTMDAQASPADTAEVQEVGVKQCRASDPSPGGAIPKVKW